MICDLAETYHILNYKELPPDLVATLVFGLNENSRTKRHFNESKLTLEQTLLALIVDDLNFIAWTKTKDAQHKRNKPKSLYKKLMGFGETKKEDVQAFESVEDYEAFMDRKRKEWSNG